MGRKPTSEPIEQYHKNLAKMKEKYRNNKEMFLKYNGLRYFNKKWDAFLSDYSNELFPKCGVKKQVKHGPQAPRPRGRPRKNITLQLDTN